MKTKIIFVLGSMRIGGIEKALVNLLNCLDFNKYDVDLFLFNNGGEFIPEIPSKVRLVNKSYILNCIGMTMSEAKKEGVFTALIRAIIAIMCKMFGNNIVLKTIFAFIPRLVGYDIAVSYSHDAGDKLLYSGYNQFVLSNVNAKRKITWIHGNYRDIINSNSKLLKTYSGFDSIVNVSKSNKELFDKLTPQLAHKSHVVYNVHCIEKLKLSASERRPIQNKKNHTCFVTVCRLDSNKGVDRIIRTAEKLVLDGYNFIWYIVGDGPERTGLEELVKNKELRNVIFFTGYQSNPYPYIRGADIFVLSSKSEAMPMVIGESLILGTPVVTTYYDSAYEQINEGVNGIVTQNNEIGLYQSLKKLLKEPELIHMLQSNLLTNGINNSIALSQFDKICKIE